MHIQYWFTIVTACVENLFFTAVLVGWPSLQYMLEQEGYFGYSCDHLNITETVSLPTDRQIQFIYRA